MPTFPTPRPIQAVVEIDLGIVRFVAEERADTAVDVQPADPTREADVKIATQTEIGFAHGTLTVKAPRQRPILGRGGAIEVTIALPAGSTVDAAPNWADVSARGPLGNCRIKTSTGAIHLAEAGPLVLTTGAGDISVDRALGHTEATTGSGRIRFHAIDGSAILKNTNGSTTVGDVTGDLTINGANGDITVERAAASVSATTAHGTLRVGEVARGSVVLETSTGSIEVGVREGSAARFNLNSDHGRIHNEVGAARDAEADASAHQVEIRARTRHGQIEVRRSRITGRTAEVRRYSI